MAGLQTEFQNRYWEEHVSHLRYNTGSLWPTLGLGPVTVINEGTAQGRLNWTDQRITESQQKGWRHRLYAGENATTGLTGSRTRLIEFSHGFYEDRWKTNIGQPTEFSYVYSQSGNLFRFPAEASGFSSYTDAENQAVSEWHKNARKVQQIVQSGVIAGELGQTLRGLFQSARQLRNGVKAFLDEIRYFYHKYPGRRAWNPRYRRYYSRREVREYLADTWLSAQFGFKPLINDIDDVMKYLATDKSILTDSERVVGVGKTSAKNFKSMPNGSYWSYALNVEDNWYVRYYGHVYRYIPGPFAGKTSLQLGFDSSSWLPTIWELIPYSFLVDYFTNIQEVITSHSFNYLTLKWCSRVRRREIVSRPVNVTPIMGPSGNTTTGYISPGSCTWSYSTIDRAHEGVPGFVSFEFEIPGLKDWRWVNMAALLGASRSMQPYVW